MFEDFELTLLVSITFFLLIIFKYICKINLSNKLYLLKFGLNIFPHIDLQNHRSPQLHSIQDRKKKKKRFFNLNQFSSVWLSQSCLTLCDPMNHSTPDLPVHHQLLEFTQTHSHWADDAIQPSHPLSSPSHPAPNPSQHQGLFQWVNSSHWVAKVLEFQLQQQSFQWTPRIDLL